MASKCVRTFSASVFMVIRVEFTGPNPRFELFFVLSVLLPRFWTSRKIAFVGVTMNLPSASSILLDFLLLRAPNVDFIFLEESTGALTVRAKNPKKCSKLFLALVAIAESPLVPAPQGEPQYADEGEPQEKEDAEDYEARYTKVLNKVSLLCGSHCDECTRNIFQLINDELYVGSDTEEDYLVALNSLRKRLLNTPVLHDVERVVEEVFEHKDTLTHDMVKECVMALKDGYFFASSDGFAHSITQDEQGVVGQRITQLRQYYNNKKK